MQTKIAEGQENPLTLIQIAKLYEVQKYVSMTSHMWDGFWMLGNKRSFSGTAGRRADDRRAGVEQVGAG